MPASVLVAGCWKKGDTIYGGDTAHRTWILIDFSILKEGTRFNATKTKVKSLLSVTLFLFLPLDNFSR